MLMKQVLHIALNVLLTTAYSFYSLYLVKHANGNFQLMDAIYFLTWTFFILLTIRVPIALFVFNAAKFISKRLALFLFIALEVLWSILHIIDTKLFESQGLHVYDKVVIKTLLNSLLNVTEKVLEFSSTSSILIYTSPSISSSLSSRLNAITSVN